MHPTRTSTGRGPEGDDPRPQPSSCPQRATRSPPASPLGRQEPLGENKAYEEPQVHAKLSEMLLDGGSGLWRGLKPPEESREEWGTSISGVI